jgi:hypothetical protein
MSTPAMPLLDLREIHHDVPQLNALEVHNQLNPLVDWIQVLLDLCIDQQDGSTSESEHRQMVLCDVLDTEVARLRERLDTLCGCKIDRKRRPTDASTS